MAVIKTTADVASKEFRANQAAMRALVAELEAQRAKAAEGGPPQARERHSGARQAFAARAGDDAHRSGHAVPRTVAARRQRHVRRRHPWRRHHHRRRPRRRPRMRHRLQRFHHQGRHLLSDDGEEAFARPGDRAREPAAVPLSGRFRRRQPAAPDRSVSRPRAFRPHLLQSGDAVGRRHCPDRGGDGLVHCWRSLRAGDVGRDHHRAQSGHDLPRRPAAGEGGDRRSRQRRRARRRRSAHQKIRRCRLHGRERPPRAGAVPPDRRRPEHQEDRSTFRSPSPPSRNTTPASSTASCRSI